MREIVALTTSNVCSSPLLFLLKKYSSFLYNQSKGNVSVSFKLTHKVYQEEL
jgi:hypothetical protein